MLFKNRNFTIGGIANVMRTVADKIDSAKMPLAERLEEAGCDVFASDEKVKVILVSMENMFSIPRNKLYIAPAFEDNTLKLKGYALALNGEALISEVDFVQLQKKMREILLSDDADVGGFKREIEDALKK